LEDFGSISAQGSTKHRFPEAVKREECNGVEEGGGSENAVEELDE
jgi:hypothetical protein